MKRYNEQKNKSSKFKKSLKEKISLKDDILSGLTFEELIITLQSNEKIQLI